MAKFRTGINLNSKLRQLLQQGCSLRIYELNYFSCRLTHEENRDTFFDWFYTTGTLMEGVKGDKYTVRIPGIFADPEAMGTFVFKRLTTHI